MKKSYLIDINQKHGHELSKKLYRTITELSKRLDDARSCARSVGDLFTPSLLIQRKKFTEYSEKLIFSDPALYGHKGEELLWRKGYYEVISAAKKLKKKEYSLEELSTLELHINAGIGFYHLFLSKLQVSFDLTLITSGDFLHVNTDKDEIKSELSEKDKEWAAQSVHQCLIYLGDLNRYKLEIYPNREPVLATRYYLQAISYKPDHGMPHNQMGTLAMSQNANIEAVYHYMRGLACKFTFEGTTNNLINLFDKNSKFIQQLPEENENADCIVDPTKTEQIKRFIARFILLIDIWYFDKTVSKVYNLCHQTFKNLDECLAFNKASDSEGGETPTDLESLGSDCSNSPRHLSSEILFQVSVICLLCISKLQKNKTQQVSTVTAFTLAVYSQLIQNISNCVQASVSIFPLPDPDVLENGKKKRKPKQRRRKPLQSESEDSELSEQEEVLSDSSDDSFISDKEDVLAESSEEELEVLNTDKAFPNDNNILQKNQLNSKENKITKTETELKQEIIDKIKRMDVNDVIEILSEQGLLRSIKVLNDWLVGDASILKSCGANTKSLMRQITYLLNILNVNSTYSKLANIDPTKFNLEQLENNYPLAEDVTLMGLEILDKAQKELDWNLRFKQSLTFKEETLIRIRKINCFGKYLTTIPETGIKFDENENIFVCQYTEEDDIKNVEELEVEEIINGKTKEAATNSKGQLMKMKHMGQLWLASEVRALENRVRGKSSLSPYLVLDADALIKYTFMVKHLVHSRKFIVIVPTSVMTALDDLKREKPEARDAIRWLESQFHRGNRFFRAQRPQEKSAIPFIKYPKKRDKEMNIYIQIIECCYFLTEQQKDATDILTLLIGKQNQVNGENNNKDFSYLGLAQSAGINVESITQFYAKWKKSTKENR